MGAAGHNGEVKWTQLRPASAFATLAHGRADLERAGRGAKMQRRTKKACFLFGNRRQPRRQPLRSLEPRTNSARRKSQCGSGLVPNWRESEKGGLRCNLPSAPRRVFVR